MLHYLPNLKCASTHCIVASLIFANASVSLHIQSRHDVPLIVVLMRVQNTNSVFRSNCLYMQTGATELVESPVRGYTFHIEDLSPVVFEIVHGHFADRLQNARHSLRTAHRLRHMYSSVRKSCSWARVVQFFVSWPRWHYLENYLDDLMTTS